MHSFALMTAKVKTQNIIYSLRFSSAPPPSPVGGFLLIEDASLKSLFIQVNESQGRQVGIVYK